MMNDREFISFEVIVAAKHGDGEAMNQKKLSRSKPKSTS